MSNLGKLRGLKDWIHSEIEAAKDKYSRSSTTKNCKSFERSASLNKYSKIKLNIGNNV